MTKERVIGYQGGLPWRLSDDLRRFKKLTMGHHIVMGRKTYESIGRPLPGRVSIVITRQAAYRAAGAVVVRSLREALLVAPEDDEVFVIGGAEIYAQALPLADRVYLTEVVGEVQGDTFFPPFDYSRWTAVSESSAPADAKNDFAHVFRILDRTGDPNTCRT